MVQQVPSGDIRTFEQVTKSDGDVVGGKYALLRLVGFVILIQCREGTSLCS